MKNETKKVNKKNEFEDLEKDPAINNFLEDILSQIKNLPEEEQEQKVFEIFKNINIDIEKSATGEWEIKKETPETEIKEKTIEEEENDEKSLQDFIYDLIKQVEHLPEDKKEEEIIKILKNKYNIEDLQTLESSSDFVADILEQEIITNEEESEKINKIMEEDQDRLPISPIIDLQNEKIEPTQTEKQKEKIRKIKIKNYLVEIATRYHNNLKIPEKIKREAKKAAVILGIIGVGLATALQTKEYISKNLKETEVSKDKQNNKKESLSKNCKETVDYFEKNNPTPGKWFVILDKDSAKSYIFNEKYELQKVFNTGIGKTKGEGNNTSYELHKGQMTTPAGVYIMSSVNAISDEKRYSRLISTLYGISVKGDSVILGMHDILKEKGREEGINNPNEKTRPLTSRVSDGCLNLSETNMDFILKHFKIEDKGELLIILPDDGLPIDLSKIMPKILKTQKEWQKSSLIK
jgi:hypothetical protein